MREALFLYPKTFIYKNERATTNSKKNSVYMNYIQYDWLSEKEECKIHTPAIRRQVF